ncbi:hypothetical protein DSO57_1011961 [Entomophthora muscae]|uniref:Uncharacterized protein n=1 Tax=Entomophthora muscae TaxID=34485 RepID=A0ACC2SVH4_9FUNG|nr:hypothetical protein DSO57_1011961 [Entomophthora muscae]
MVPNSRPWSLLGQSVSYIIKLAPILWWALPASLAVPHPEPPKASTYKWLPDIYTENKFIIILNRNPRKTRLCQGSNLRGLPEDLRADGPRAQQGEPTTVLGLALQYKITTFQVSPKVRL